MACTGAEGWHQHPFGGLGSSVLPCSGAGAGGKELSFSAAPRGFKGVLVWVWLSRPVFARQMEHSPGSVSAAAVSGPAGTRLSGKRDRHGGLAWRDLPCPAPSFYTPSLPFRHSPQVTPARTAHCRCHRHPDPSPLPPGSRQPSRLSAGPCQCPQRSVPAAFSHTVLLQQQASPASRRSTLPRACPCTSDGAPPQSTLLRAEAGQGAAARKRGGDTCQHMKEMFAALLSISGFAYCLGKST